MLLCVKKIKYKIVDNKKKETFELEFFLIYTDFEKVTQRSVAIYYMLQMQ